MRSNSRDLIKEELRILSEVEVSACFSRFKSFEFSSVFLDLLLLFGFACLSRGLMLKLKPIPPTAKVNTMVSVILGGIAQNFPE